MRWILTVLGLLLLAPAAIAEEREPSYLCLAGQYAAVQAVDAFTTDLLISRGGHEAIPWMRDRTTRLVVKLAIAPFVMAALDKGMSGHPNLRRFFRRLNFGVFLGIGAWNLSLAVSL